MKFLFWIAATFMVSAAVYGQQIPLYSQYHHNPFLYNPAKTGEKVNLHAFLIYRKQWIDFKGAPETRALSLDGAIKDGKIGLGGLIYSDVTDMIERFGGNLYYSYVFKIKSDDHRFGIGISAGIQETRVDFSDVILDDPNEPLQGSVEKGLAFDGSAGINYWFKGFQFGFAVPQIVQTKIKYISETDPLRYQLARHYLITTSYDIKVIKDVFSIEPNAMMRLAKGNTYQVDAGVQFKYKQMAWVGALYRYDYAITVGGGLKVHDRVSVGYAYDLALNTLKNYSKGSHEVMVGIKFGKTEDKGLIEAIKGLEKNQQEQAQEIMRITEENQKLAQEGEELKKFAETEKEQSAQLKEEMKRMERELKDSLKNVKVEVVEVQKEIPATTQPEKKKQPQVEEDKAKTAEEVVDDAAAAVGQYYIVVGAFKSKSNAKRTADLLVYQQPGAGIVYNKVLKNYYVYLDKLDSWDGAKQKVDRLKRETQYKDAWIYSVKD